MPPGTRIFSFSMSAMVLSFLSRVKMCAGPWVQMPDQMHALVFVGRLEELVVGLPVGDAGRHGVRRQERQLDALVEHEAVGGVAVDAHADVGDAVLDQIEMRRRSAERADELDLDVAFGGLLDLLRPDLEHLDGQRMGRRHPVGKAPDGLRRSRRRAKERCGQRQAAKLRVAILNMWSSLSYLDGIMPFIAGRRQAVRSFVSSTSVSRDARILGLNCCSWVQRPATSSATAGTG